MNIIQQEPILGGDQNNEHQRTLSPQQSSNTHSYSQNTGGRSANNITPAMSKNIELDLMGQNGNAQPFSGYNNSVIGNNQHIEELQNNYAYIKNDVNQLQKQIEESKKNQPTLEGMNQNDAKMHQLLVQMNQKYEQQLDIIEKQIKIFSPTGSNVKIEGVDEMTVKKLEEEQIKVKSEMSQIKLDMEAIKNDQKQVVSGKNQQDQSMNQNTPKINYQQQLEELQKTIRVLQQQTAAPSDLERENRELKEKLNNYQRDTSNQIEELRKMILSNPQMMMDSHRGAYDQYNNHEVETIDSKMSYELRNMDDEFEKSKQGNQRYQNNDLNKYNSVSSLEIAAKLMQPDLFQTESSSEESQKQIKDSFGFRQSGSDKVSIKMTQSTMSLDQLTIPKRKKSDIVIGEIEEEEGETLVFDAKTKKYSPISSPLQPTSGRFGNMSASQARMMQSADNMRKSNIKESKQLFEVNVHDLTFKDDNVTQYFNDRTSLSEIAYSIMVSQPERDSQGNIISPTINKTTTLDQNTNTSSEFQHTSPTKSNTYPPKQVTIQTQSLNNPTKYQITPIKECHSPSVKASYSKSNSMQVSGDEPPEDEDYDSEEEEMKKPKAKKVDNQEEAASQNDENGFQMDQQGNHILMQEVN